MRGIVAALRRNYGVFTDTAAHQVAYHGVLA
jgi:hypothetical protein